MNTRLYRLTPAGGKPNHYTDSYASALAKLPNPWDKPNLDGLDVGEKLAVSRLERQPGVDTWHDVGTWERIA